MKPTLKNLSDKLKKENIRLSHQRLKVLEYLVNNRCHPTADQIYQGLLKDVPSLSKTTIYNTLNSLVESGIVRVITIEGNEIRYDIETEDHGHFKCSSCGKIFDFDLDFEKLSLDSLVTDSLKGFMIADKDVYVKGLCPDCLSYINKYK